MVPVAYSVRKVHEAFHPPLPKEFLVRAIALGEIRTIRLGRGRYITREALLAWLESAPIYTKKPRKRSAPRIDPEDADNDEDI